MTFKRIYIKFNNGGVFTYMDPDGFDCYITDNSISIEVEHTGDLQNFELMFSRDTIAFYRYEQTESGNGTEQ